VGNKRLTTIRSHLWRKLWWTGLHQLLLLPLFIWAILKFDVFIFGFSSTFFYYYDLPILKALGKTIFYVFNGSDARPPYLDGAILAVDQTISLEQSLTLTKKQKKKLTRIEPYADIVINHIFSAHFHQKQCINWLQIGLPYQPTLSEEQTMAEPSTSAQQPVRILHSPSNPVAKGTPAIRQAIAALKTRGYNIDYIEIIGQPNQVVIQELGRCNFVIDQLYSDTPMAGFAAEAAFCGKPTIVGGYGWPHLKTLFAPEDIPPSHLCHPDDLEAAIEYLIVNPAYRKALGQKAYAFVQARWTPLKVAERYMRLIQEDIPPEWLYYPADIRYLHGFGMPEERIKCLIKQFIEAGGRAALQLSDKPTLEQLLTNFAVTKET
jgi:hypothetical protein